MKELEFNRLPGGEISLVHSMNPQAYNATVLAFLAKHAG